MNNLVIQGMAMSLLGGNDLKEQQKINELELKINREKQKLDKKLTRQKILLGAFFVDTLDKNNVKGLKQYTVRNLPDFLTRKTDQDLMKELIESLKDSETHDENDVTEVANTDKHDSIRANFP